VVQKNHWDEALELATSEQLIEELMHRNTFVGIIIRPSIVDAEHFYEGEFQMSIRNMPKEVAADILEHAIESLGEPT
jgi:hypothetical protein